MANVSKASNTRDFAPGFTFQAFSTGLEESLARLETLLVQLAGQPLPELLPVPGGFRLDYPDGTRIDFDGTLRREHASLRALDLQQDTLHLAISGKARFDLRDNTFDGPVQVREISFGDDDDFSVALSGSLKIDDSDLDIHGSARTLYLLSAIDEDSAHYVRLDGAVNLRSGNGNIQALEWGIVDQNGDGNSVFSPTGELHGLKIKAQQLLPALEADGFDAMLPLAFAGNDRITGTNGDDILSGFAGRDRISGGNDDDLIDGGSGADRLHGGAGADTFVIANLPDGGFDRILDFASGDSLRLDTAVFSQLSGATAANFVLGRAAVEGDDFLIYDAGRGALYYDADGSGAVAAIQIAGIKGSGADSFDFDDLQFG